MMQSTKGNYCKVISPVEKKKKVGFTVKKFHHLKLPQPSVTAVKCFHVQFLIYVEVPQDIVHHCAVQIGCK